MVRIFIESPLDKIEKVTDSAWYGYFSLTYIQVSKYWYSLRSAK